MASELRDELQRALLIGDLIEIQTHLELVRTINGESELQQARQKLSEFRRRFEEITR